jgi:protocatechuate 3,4-dioxygenase beta subunit
MRPPHIHFEVHGRFERLITQTYFPGEPLNACDRLLNAALRPDLLVAKPVPSEDGSGYRVLDFDIVLAGIDVLLPAGPKHFGKRRYQ